MNMTKQTDETLLHIEAVILASPAPVTIARLKQAFDNQFSSQELRQLLQQLASLQHGRATELVETAQGYRFQIRAQYQHVIQRAYPDKAIKLSQSLLEILTTIAYHQPITRAEIEQFRGVSNNSQSLKTLFEWNWIKESGFKDTVGRPALLVTTPQFLDAFSLVSLNHLPPLADIQSDAAQLTLKPSQLVPIVSSAEAC